MSSSFDRVFDRLTLNPIGIYFEVMYKPEKFQVHDLGVLTQIIQEFPFATVVTVADGKPFVNHLPITIQTEPNGEITLLGHMSKQNPQWHHFKSGSEVTVAFHGPHTYVSPTWYQKDDVPTWNYIVVHATGTMKVIEDHEGLVETLKHLNDHMNSSYQEQWDFYLPPARQSEAYLTSAIVGFVMKPTELIGKFKLSQNRSQEDKKGVVKGLEARSDEGSQQVREWMMKLLE